jgi:hypothetical protein
MGLALNSERENMVKLRGWAGFEAETLFGTCEKLEK